MVRLFFIGLFSFLFWGLAGQATLELTSDPEQARLITSDIERFWEAYDLAYPWFSPDIIDSLYLRPGTEGLRACAALLLGDARSLSELLHDEWDYYESVRAASLAVRRQEAAIRAALFALKYLYPEARFPDIYFLIGGRDAVGLPLDDRLIINAGQFGALPPPPTRARRQAPPRFATEALPQVVVREIVRYQMPVEGPQPLLGLCLREGIADLISELATGRPFRPDLERFAAPREAALWWEFSAHMRLLATNGWLYHNSGDRPANLGIWIGYRIARSYYERAVDKRQAIRDMMPLQDVDAFLEKSGYGVGEVGSRPPSGDVGFGQRRRQPEVEPTGRNPTLPGSGSEVKPVSASFGNHY